MAMATETLEQRRHRYSRELATHTYKQWQDAKRSVERQNPEAGSQGRRNGVASKAADHPAQMAGLAPLLPPAHGDSLA